MREPIKRTIKFSSPLRYQGNLFFLILLFVVWFPIGVLLLIKNGYIVQEMSKFSLEYQGKWRWVFFWGVFFFPVAFLLLFLKGIDVIEEEMAF